MEASQPDRRALALMAITVTLWGFSWVVMKQMTQYIGPFDLVTARYCGAFVVLFALLRLRGHSMRFPPFWLMMGVGVFQTAAFQCFAQLALLYGGAGHVVMLAYTMPFWVVLFSWLLLSERPGRRQQLGLALAALGLISVVAPWQGMGTMTGSLLALTGGVCWGLGAVLAKIMFQRHRLDLMGVTTWQMFLGALFTLPLALLVPQQPISWQPALFLGMAYMAVLASAVGWWLWLAVVRRVSATVAGMSSLGVPVLVIVLAWLLLGEQPTRLELLGIALIMMGLIAVNWPSPRKKVRTL